MEQGTKKRVLGVLLLSASALAVPLAVAVSRHARPRPEGISEIATISSSDLRAPTDPPQSFIRSADPHVNEPVRQAGVMVHYDWIIGGTARSYSMKPPISWPSPLEVRTRTIEFELHSAIYPETLEFRVYRNIERDGAPAGVPDLIYCNEGPTLEKECEEMRDITKGPLRWSIRLNPPKGTYFIVGSGTWADTAKARTHIASWLFRVVT
jgi:hypothetical protein